METDTIAAIVTASGEAGVAVVRVSGPDALPLADRLFRCSPPLPSRRSAYTFVYGKVEEARLEIDEALLLIFRAPHSYTAEDVVEFQCHGGGATARRILRACCQQGARLAEPGEFTRRAFLNGRLDLLQAEAVMDLIRAQSERAQTAAIEQLEGKLSQQFHALYDQLLAVVAQLEALLDFPEDELPESVPARIRAEVDAAAGSVDALLKGWNEGHVLRDGALVVLSGKPNVGKSTLLNALLGKDRAIVSDQPGTTRDSIEADFEIDGFPLRLVDTAGLRESGDHIELAGMARTRKYLEKADLHLHLVDLHQPADAQTHENFAQLHPRKSILVCNKADLPRRFHVEHWPEVPRVETALARGEGLEDLKAAIRGRLSSSIDFSARPHAVISERHRQILQLVQTEIAAIRDLLAESSQEESLVLAIPGLRESLRQLGEITGREYHEELLDQIFSRFCIGK